MKGREKELITLAVAILSGASVRLVYECLACFRKIVKHSPAVVEAEELLFWIGTALYLFVQIYQTSSGSIRWHFVLGVVLGTIFMGFFLKKMKKLQKKIYTRRGKKS